MSTRLILDVATCPLTGADDWIDPVKVDKRLVDPVKIAADLAEKTAEQRGKLALDLDLCRISAIGYCDVSGWAAGPVLVRTAETEDDEKTLLSDLHKTLRNAETITWNGLGFDLPVIERRMMYLGLPPLNWTLDRYRTKHVDLMQKLSGGDKNRYRSLSWYLKRLGYTDLVKPLSGAEEAQAPAKGQWLELAESIRHDVVGTLRVAQWTRVVQLPAAEDEIQLGDGLIITEGSIL